MYSDLANYLKTFTPESEKVKLAELERKSKRSEHEQFLLELLTTRDYYRSNLYALCKDILGYDQLVTHLHTIMADHIQHTLISDILLEVARGHFKTTIARGFAVQILLNHPNWSVMVLTSNDDKARDLGNPARKIFLTNPKLHEIFPDYCPPEGSTEKNWGSKHFFDLPNRTKIDQNHSFMCMSFGSSVSMYHPHIIICDDIVDDKNLGEMKMPKIIENFELLHPLLDDSEPGSGHMLYIGTRYADNDLQGMLVSGDFGKIVSDETELTEEDKETGYWFSLSLPATIDGTVDGDPIFPERFSRAKLKRLRDKLRNYRYSCQFLLDPVPQTDADIQEEWFRVNDEFKWEVQHGQVYIDGEPMVMNIYMTVDPAIVVGKKNDYTAAVVAGIDAHGHWWVLECYRGRKRIADTYNFISDMAERCCVQVVGWEAGAIQGEFFRQFKQHARETARQFVVKPLHPQEKGFHLNKKEDRIIQSIAPALSQGRVHLAQGKCDALVQQCIRLPRGKHEDVADCFGYMLGWFERRPHEATPIIPHNRLQDHKQWCIEESLREQEEGPEDVMSIDWPLSSFA